MNHQIHRKQIIVLVLALLLAMASYLIPLPQRPEQQPKSGVYAPVRQAAPAKPPIVTRETAITWRFPIKTQIPQADDVSTLDASVGERSQTQPMAVERLVSREKLARDEKIQAAGAPLVSLKKINQLPNQ